MVLGNALNKTIPAMNECLGLIFGRLIFAFIYFPLIVNEIQLLGPFAHLLSKMLVILLFIGEIYSLFWIHSTILYTHHLWWCLSH